MPAYPTRLAQVGLVKESSYGAGGTPAMLLPVTQLQPADVVGRVDDDSWRSAPAVVFGHQVTTLESTVKLGGIVMPDSVGFLLAGILGDVAFAAGSPNTWTMALLNSGAQQPASYAVTVADPIGQLAYAGCKVSELTLAFDPDQLLAWSATLAGLASGAVSVSMPAASSEKPIPGWVGVVKVGGVVTGQVASAEVQLSRPVVAHRTVTGAQAPWLQRSDVLAVSGKLTVVASSDSYRTQWQAGTATSLDLSFSNGVAGAGARSLTLHCSQVVLEQAPRSYGARWIEVDVTFQAEANASDVGASGGLSPIKATLKNQVGSGVYA
jgi:hypothetical protein